jgi:hypothetical protein
MNTQTLIALGGADLEHRAQEVIDLMAKSRPSEAHRIRFLILEPYEGIVGARSPTQVAIMADMSAQIGEQYHNAFQRMNDEVKDGTDTYRQTSKGITNTHLTYMLYMKVEE